MTAEDFARLLDAFTASAESGDGARFAAHFTEDAIYHHYIYGPHAGRAVFDVTRTEGGRNGRVAHSLKPGLAVMMTLVRS